MLTKIDYKYFKEKQTNLKVSIIESEIYPQLDEKIEELFTLINKYFTGVENIDDNTEKKLIEETIKYEEERIVNSVIDDRWAFINICKN